MAASWRASLGDSRLKEETIKLVRELDDWDAELDGWLTLLEEGERPALLRRLQRLGVNSLAERQPRC